MRILHVARTLDPHYGGPPVLVSRLAAGQASLGHEVSILGHMIAGAEPRVEGLLEGMPFSERVAHHGVSADSRLERLTSRQARQEIEARLEGVDFVILHGLWAPIHVTAARVARRLRVPYAIAPHGQLDPWSLSQKRWKKRLAFALFHRRMAEGAAFIQTSNDDERRLIEPLALSSPVEILPNGVFLEEFDALPEPGGYQAILPELDGEPFVLFISRLHYKKGLDVLAESFVRLAAGTDRIHLVVAGTDEGHRAQFEERIAAAGLDQRVHVVGPLFGDDKLAALADASCFCLPSRQEAFSMAIVEAMACGLPVVITEGCHFPEVAEFEAGVVTPLDPQAIAAALERTVLDTDRRRAMGRNARALVESRFTWPKIAADSIALYERYRG